MYVNFEIAAPFSSPCNRVKKSGNFKTNIFLVSVESFLDYLSSKNMIISKVLSKHVKNVSNCIKKHWNSSLFRSAPRALKTFRPPRPKCFLPKSWRGRFFTKYSTVPPPPRPPAPPPPQLLGKISYVLYSL